MTRLWSVLLGWRKPKHVHTWVNLGYGGAGWHLIRCATCDECEIS